MAQNFQNMAENIKIQEAHQSPRKINRTKIISRHTIVKHKKS